MAANTAYRTPGVSGTTTSIAQTTVNPGVRRMALIGVAGQGPDLPTEYADEASAAAAFGAPGAAGTLPWAIHAAMGARPAGGTPAPCIICRVNVTRATLALMDGAGSPAVWATLSGKGIYAGTAGNGATPLGLYATVAAGTAGSSKKVTITKGTGGGAVTLAIYDNLKLPADLVAAASADPYIDVQPGPSVLVPATLSATAFSGGADGLTTAANDASIAAMLTLLFNGATTAPRYLCALWDGATVATAVAAALSSALTSGATPAPCIAYLGSLLSSTISANATAAATISNPAIVFWGMPGGRRPDPALNNALRIFDGFYQAATLMGMKAALPVEQSLINLPLFGWDSNAPIASGSLNRQPVLADVLTLGQNGATYALSGPGYNGLEVQDQITTAQTWGTNTAWQTQAAMQDSHHHAQVATYAAANSFKGQPAPINSDLSNPIATQINSSLQTLAGSSIHSVNAVSVTPDPATVGRYVPQVSYNLRATVRNIDFTFSVGVQS